MKLSLYFNNSKLKFASLGERLHAKIIVVEINKILDNTARISDIFWFRVRAFEMQIICVLKGALALLISPEKHGDTCWQNCSWCNFSQYSIRYDSYFLLTLLHLSLTNYRGSCYQWCREFPSKVCILLINSTLFLLLIFWMFYNIIMHFWNIFLILDFAKAIKNYLLS